ncbi:CorA family divalent cation transporter, partial [Allosphingosinicella sp.]|uniref:CorA family divalent cation transporter n=1 Tax=Allosphingosinicella sp. TaxID=2823234 RepID=UPI002EF066E4
MDRAFLAEGGSVREVAVAEAGKYRGEGFLWIHLEGRDEHDLTFLQRQDDIPDIAANALIATETRPRCDRIEDGAIVNLRGPGEVDPEDSDRLVSIRMWVRRNRVTTLSRR